MKIKNFLLTLLFSGITFMCLSANLNAEVILDPMASGDEDYIALLEAQGEYAYAFDFFTTSMLWTVIAAALVFLMHLGFATLEAGLTQAKNTVNILFKNVFIICIGLFTYALIGFNTHYPGDGWIIDGWLAFGGEFGYALTAAGNADDTFGYGGVGLAMTGYGDFIFQAMFAATAATIVSGAVAERVKLGSFMIFATLLVAIAYPMVGAWHWGGGWLGSLEGGFYDFAGSSVVHAFGGFAALACVMILGPRSGKYVDGKIKPILGHSMPLATIGVFLLFLGWFGFNGGSVLSANPAGVGLVFVTTALAAAAGGLASILVSMLFLKKPDLSMALNGILAGLVGITAGADAMGAWAAITVGAIAGVIVVFSILFFDKIQIDDPVGAISVHGVCGIWGTLAVGIWGGANFATQLIGTLSVSIAAFAFAFIVFGIIKAVMGVRVSPEEEAEGLDLSEHGQAAYPDFAQS
ncbi:MAG: ammonium transporter [Verrucomicrobiota bacterium]|nr:ammonium transporter [Verrucomicrobiota bacterium]MEC8649640.1 ammonium transporter [Verrucomicrobiota bacterium]